MSKERAATWRELPDAGQLALRAGARAPEAGLYPDQRYGIRP